MRALVLDNYADSRSALEELLSLEGYEVTAAAHDAGPTLVDAVLPDIVVLDVHGTGGERVLRDLRARTNAPIVVTATWRLELDAERLAQAVFLKPFEPRDLVKVMSMTVRLRRSGTVSSSVA